MAIMLDRARSAGSWIAARTCARDAIELWSWTPSSDISSASRSHVAVGGGLSSSFFSPFLGRVPSDLVNAASDAWEYLNFSSPDPFSDLCSDLTANQRRQLWR